jgi:hypothetical protein
MVTRNKYNLVLVKSLIISITLLAKPPIVSYPRFNRNRSNGIVLTFGLGNVKPSSSLRKS